MNEDKTHYYKPSVTKGEYVNEKELIENLVYPDTMYKKQIQELEQQLQSYKDKEDKLREYIKYNWVIDEPIKFKNDILDIPNDKVAK